MTLPWKLFVFVAVGLEKVCRIFSVLSGRNRTKQSIMLVENGHDDDDNDGLDEGKEERERERQKKKQMRSDKFQRLSVDCKYRRGIGWNDH